MCYGMSYSVSSAVYNVCIGWCSGCILFLMQKTAYEVRISDWSSDVCSADLYLTIEADEDEARTVFAYMPNGDELGPLLAAPPWDREPHSFWMRKKIVALIRAHRWNPENFSDPIKALFRRSRRKGTKSKVCHLRILAAK